MAKVKDRRYFDTFIQLAEYSCDAASLLEEIINNYDLKRIPGKLKEMGKIEDAGNITRQVMIKKLVGEFITPLAREDIIAISDAIDHVTDSIEEALLRMYMSNIQSMSTDVVKMGKNIVRCCDALKEALNELPNFKKSQSLRRLMARINTLDEEGNKILIEGIRRLYLEQKEKGPVRGPIDIFLMDQLLHSMKNCCKACKDASNTIERVIIKNL